MRARLVGLLEAGWMSALELSQSVGIPEKSVPEHLAHLRRSLSRQRRRLEIDPATCLGCGFEFTVRERLDRPSRCPKCRSERVAPPRFRVTG